MPGVPVSRLMLIGCKRSDADFMHTAPSTIGHYNDDYGATPVEIEKRRIKVKQISFYQNDIN